MRSKNSSLTACLHWICPCLRKEDLNETRDRFDANKTIQIEDIPRYCNNICDYKCNKLIYYAKCHFMYNCSEIIDRSCYSIKRCDALAGPNKKHSTDEFNSELPSVEVSEKLADDKTKEMIGQDLEEK